MFVVVFAFYRDQQHHHCDHRRRQPHDHGHPREPLKIAGVAHVAAVYVDVGVVGAAVVVGAASGVAALAVAGVVVVAPGVDVVALDGEEREQVRRRHIYAISWTCSSILGYS